jgi:N-terminal domain of anti-restriction factor ArdC
MPRGEHDRPGGLPPHEKTQEALKTLEAGIDAILTGESFAEYLCTMARFHSYSAGNIALIRFQHHEATRVAGYRKWLELGRQVKKGERGIKILVPYKYRTKSEEGNEEETVSLRGFGVGSVFDVSQTEGPPLPEPPQVVFVAGATDSGMRLYVDLLDYLELQGVSADREETAPSNGYFDPLRRHVGIGTHIDGDQATKTLTHETAHVVAGHMLGTSNPDVETIAESAAFVVLNHYGIDSSGYSFPYVARWAQDRAVLKRNLDAIQRTAHEIIAAIEGEEAV